MDKAFSKQVLNCIEVVLKEIAPDVCNDKSSHYDLENEISQRVQNKMENLHRSLKFKLAIPRTIEIKRARYKISPPRSGIIQGKITLEHCQKRDTFKYGGPGYPGREDGQLCVYPENSRQFYKWNSQICKWQHIYHTLRQGQQHEQTLFDKLTNNAAFEPMWGNYPSMDGMKSDRKRNGTKDLWGDPGIRKLNSSFRTISANVMESIYNFAYDFRKILKFYDEIGDALDLEKKEIEPNSNSSEKKENPFSNDTITYRLETRDIETRTNKYFNGFSKDIVGYQQAQKDSAYHVNRSNSSIRIEVEITKKY